jgi:hypothetical protein
MISWISDINKSRWVSNCIQTSFDMLVDGFYENNKQPLVGIRRRRNGTIPKTFTLPLKIANTLNWFAKTLNVRKSHLVTVCVLNSEYGDLEGKSHRLENLMRIADEIS